MGRWDGRDGRDGHIYVGRLGGRDRIVCCKFDTFIAFTDILY